MLNLDEVRGFCKRSHHGQTRWDGSEYYNHPLRVAQRTAELLTDLPTNLTARPPDDQVLAAALLHDVLEDCRVDYEDIASRFGEPVADMVAQLSDDKRLPAERRLAVYRAALAEAPPWVQVIKLADLIDNACDICPGTPKRRGRWAVKAVGMLNSLAHVADWPAAAQLRDQLTAMVAELHSPA